MLKQIDFSQASQVISKIQLQQYYYHSNTIISREHRYHSNSCTSAYRTIHFSKYNFAFALCLDHNTTALPQQYHRHHCTCLTSSSSRGILFGNAERHFSHACTCRTTPSLSRVAPLDIWLWTVWRVPPQKIFPAFSSMHGAAVPIPDRATKRRPVFSGQNLSRATLTVNWLLHVVLSWGLVRRGSLDFVNAPASPLPPLSLPLVCLAPSH